MLQRTWRKWLWGMAAAFCAAVFIGFLRSELYDPETEALQEKAQAWLETFHRGDEDSYHAELSFMGEGKRVVPTLILALQKRDSRLKEAYLAFYAQLPKSIASRLRPPHSAARLRERAARLLAQIGPPAEEAAPELMRRLKDPDPRVRQSSVFALGRVGSNQAGAAASLTEAFLDNDRNVRFNALVSLFNSRPAFVIGMDQIHKVLLPGLKDPNEVLQYAAVNACFELPQRIKQIPEPVILRLKELAESADANLGARASAALSRIDPQHNAERPPAHPLLF